MKKLSDEYDELEQAHNTTYGEFKTVRDDLHRLWKVKSCRGRYLLPPVLTSAQRNKSSKIDPKHDRKRRNYHDEKYQTGRTSLYRLSAFIRRTAKRLLSGAKPLTDGRPLSDQGRRAGRTHSREMPLPF